MKTFKEFLKEKWHETIEGGDLSVHHDNVDVHVNPSRNETENQLSDSEGYTPHLRGYHDHDSGKTYTWDGDKAMHANIINHHNDTAKQEGKPPIKKVSCFKIERNDDADKWVHLPNSLPGHPNVKDVGRSHESVLHPRLVKHGGYDEETQKHN